MKRHVTSRIVAVLLALAMLAATGLAEEVILEDALPEEGEGIVIEDGDLELSDELIDLDLDGALDLDGEVAGLSTETPADTEEARENADSSQILLGVKEKYTLNAKAIGSGKKVTFKSSNKKVATVTSKGVIKGVKKGTVKITCTVKGGKTVKYYVKVVAAPGSVTLAKSTVTLGVKESVTLTPSVPDGTHASYTWSTRDKSIATVTKAGKITGKKAGKTTITVRTHNGKTAKVTVKVKKAPGKVTLSSTSASLQVGKTLKLKATLPSNTYSSITWSTSNSGVATVSTAGKVTAVSVGTATITAETFNGKKAACEVTVKSDSVGDVVYRALLIGEEYFSGQSKCSRNRGDVSAMTKMLKNVTGLEGGSFSITQKYDLSASQVLSAARNAFANADDNDVSLFFIATHGDVDYSGDYAGALAMSPSGSLLLKDLADTLKAVPGKVIVILESCGAGASVYANGGNASNADKKALYEEAKKQTEAFDAAVIRAFSSVDPGALASNTGEFRVSNKFYVLAASRYQELSWGWESGNAETSYNYFTLWLTEGVGIVRRSGGSGFDVTATMPADANNNGQATLNELYRYVSKVGDNYPFNIDGTVYYQHVQVYPANSDYVLFCR